MLTAGGTASIVTPGALTLKGAILSADTVKVNAGSLAIESLQDSERFTSSQTSVGISVSVAQGGSVGVSGNFSSERQSESFKSVVEQSGIKAGAGGFDINVIGATDLKGAVIASTADPSLNKLSTGTLTASDPTNTETSYGDTLLNP